MNSPTSKNPWLGRFIGDNQRYRVDKLIGGGGMGDVFLATDTRLGQQVVLKLLKDTLVSSGEMRKRFEREVAVCAALQSEHIVRISDYGVTPEGFPFYVMEYLRGETLRQVMLREKHLSVERTVSIATQVCLGLQLPHQGVTLRRDEGKNAELIKVVHRDLKPENIFLIPTDLGEWVKILDFGVAKIRSDSSEQANITNITSTFLGTFRYAAPEQIQSDQDLDGAADIYSLGMILYEMLSAADPFGLSTTSGNIGEASWLLAHTRESPKSLRSQPGCEHLSSQLEAVVMKCLQKKPNDRFTSVNELNQALQAAAKPLIGSTGVESRQINPQSQPLQSRGSYDQTIAKPIKEVEQGNQEAMMQQRRRATLSLQQRLDGTIMQLRRRATLSLQQRLDGTIIQLRRRATPSPQQRLDGTIIQQRQAATPSPQQPPDGTMNPLNQNELQTARKFVKVVLILALVFGIGTAFGSYIYMYIHSQSYQNLNEKSLPKKQL